jgi:hypothetical protein
MSIREGKRTARKPVLSHGPRLSLGVFVQSAEFQQYLPNVNSIARPRPFYSQASYKEAHVLTNSYVLLCLGDYD